MRNIPDVALTADNIYVLANNGQSEPGGQRHQLRRAIVGGLYRARPISRPPAWAGRRLVFSIRPLYAIGKSPNYAADFQDINHRK